MVWEPPNGDADLKFRKKIADLERPPFDLKFSLTDDDVPPVFFTLGVLTYRPTFRLVVKRSVEEDSIRLQTTAKVPVFKASLNSLGYVRRSLRLAIRLTTPELLVIKENWVPVPPRFFSAVISKAQPKLAFRSVYDNRVFRGLSKTPRFNHTVASRFSAGLESDWQVADHFRTRKEFPHSDATATPSGIMEGFSAGIPTDNAGSILFTLTDPLGLRKRSPFEAGVPVSRVRDEFFVEAIPVSRGMRSVAQEGVRSSSGRDFLWGGGIPLDRPMGATHGIGLRVWRVRRYIPWGEGVDLIVGKTAWDTLPPRSIHTEDPNGYKPPVGETNIDFAGTTTGSDLNFGDYDDGPNVHNWRLRIVSNEFLMTRVDGGDHIDAHNIEIETARDSWAWSFRASISAFDFGKIEPQASGPVEIEVVVNGMVWRFLVESYSTRSSFPATDVTITGRSVTAYLDDPYAARRSFSFADAIVARQVAIAEVERPGLVTSFDINWNLVENDIIDWTFQPSFWSYDSMTPIQVIKELVSGVKGGVQSDPALRRLHVFSSYPKGPYWKWTENSPDVVLPRSLLLTESLSMNANPAYDGVWVSGDKYGVSDFVKREGYSGQIQQEMFVSPFISTHAAAREAGKTILGAGGTKANMTLEFPFLRDVGVIGVSKLLRVAGGAASPWMGMVRGTKISVQWSDSEGLLATQTLQVERSYGV